MTLRTKDELSARVSAELAWRRKELIFFKNLVHQAPPAARASFIRGAVAILYAHWEGFVKATGELYLEFITAQRLTYRQLASPLLAIAARKWIHSASESRKATPWVELINLFMSAELDGRAKSIERTIETRANLSVDVFKNICSTIGMPYRQEYSVAEKPIIERLLEVRNSIAHGEYSVIDLQEFDQLHSRIDLMLTLFGNDVENAVATDGYRRPA